MFRLVTAEYKNGDISSSRDTLDGEFKQEVKSSEKPPFDRDRLNQPFWGKFAGRFWIPRILPTPGAVFVVVPMETQVAESPYFNQ